MFMNTIAVGPFDEVASWVTGGTTVAIDRLGGASRKIRFKGACCVHVAVVLVRMEVGEFLQSCDIGFRSAIIDSKVATERRRYDGGNVKFESVIGMAHIVHCDCILRLYLVVSMTPPKL